MLRGSTDFQLREEEPLPWRRDDDDDFEPRRSRKGLWAAIIVLTLAIGAAGYFLITDQGGRLAAAPALESSVKAVGDRMSAAERALRDWDQKKFDGRLATLETGVEQKFQGARKQAQQAMDAMAAKLRGEFNSRTDRIDARLASIEKERNEARTEVASLQGEISQLREQLSQQLERIAAAERNNLADKQAVETKLAERIAGVQRDVGEGRREFTRLSNSLATRRLDFEASRNRTSEVAQGVSLTITGTDVARRRVHGSMFVMPDRKTIWLREQGAMQPVIFYSNADGRRREIVFTNVTRNSVVGYVIVPADANAASANASSERTGE